MPALVALVGRLRRDRAGDRRAHGRAGLGGGAAVSGPREPSPDNRGCRSSRSGARSVWSGRSSIAGCTMCPWVASVG